jgi:hypothetical protein
MPNFDSEAISMPVAQKIVILLSRLPKTEDAPRPGLIGLSVGTSEGAAPPARVGALTDAALRGRLAHFDQHSANEIAAVRQALGKDGGCVTVHETWAGLPSCLQFWRGFIGSRIQTFAWLCDKCGSNAEESVGGAVGESFALRCSCGETKETTIPR